MATSQVAYGSTTTYGSATSFLGAKGVLIPLLEENEFRMNPDDIKKRITNKTKLIIVNSPQNPTGSVMTKSELDEIAELAEKHNIFIVSIILRLSFL